MARDAWGESGFSILEFLLMAVILGVGLLGLGALQVATLRARGATRVRLEALALATSCLEQALGEGRIGQGGAGASPFAAAAPGFEAVETGRTATPGELRVRVSWREGGGGALQALLLSRLACP